MTVALAVLLLLGCWEARPPKLCLEARRLEGEVVVRVSQGRGPIFALITCNEPVTLLQGARFNVYSSSGDQVWEIVASEDILLQEMVLGRAPAGTVATEPLRPDRVTPGAELPVTISPGFQGRGSLLVPGL